LDKELLDQFLEKNPFEAISVVVFKMLQNQILTYKIPPGTRLNVSKIANSLEISRTPVKQAIDELVKIGLVETFPDKSGYYVFQMSRLTLEDLFLARKLIEGKAAYLCAVKNSGVDKKCLKRLAFEFRDIFYTQNFEELNKVDIVFHEIIVRSSKNRFLIEMYQCLRKMIYFHSYRTVYVLHNSSFGDDLTNLASQHLSIYKAIELGLPEMAEDALYAHLDSCISYARRHATY